MKWVFIIPGILGCLILIVIVIGYLLPVKHTASVKISVKATPDQVWERLTNFKKYPEWRKDVTSVSPVSDTEWIEISKDDMKLPIKIIVKDYQRRMVTQITGKDLPFGGQWEYELTPNTNETIIVITENGEIYHPFFRFVSKFITGYPATLKKYANYLAISFK